MIITIEGNTGEGKTTLAKTICIGKKFLFIEESFLRSPFWTSQLDDETDFILVDNIRNYKTTKDIFENEFLTINRRSENAFDIKMPDVILVKD